MKLINIFSLIGLLALLGCSDFLNEDMQGTYSSTTFFKTKDHAVLALNACYEPLALKNTRNCLWVFGDVASDDAAKGGNPGDQSDIGYIDNFEVNPDNGYIELIWQHYYEGIMRANQVIANVPDISMDEELKKQYLSEAQFLRAFYYFNLVNIFGEIPLKVTPAKTTNDLHVGLSSVEEIYSQIEIDLQDAIEGLPNESSYSDYGRATKGAALGLLAKTFLYQQKWQDALAAVQEIESLGYSLVDVYSHNFCVDYENNNESVFEIQHLSGQDPFMGNSLNQWFAPKSENGYFFNVPQQDFIDEFETVDGTIYDPRLDYTVGREGKTWLNGEEFNPAWSPTGYLQKKHLQPLSEIEKGTKGDGDLNYTYMRFAEVLLIKAEALNELSRSEEALIPLNKVRKRARESYLFDTDLPGYGTIPGGLLPDITVTNKLELRSAIMHERRVELGFEFHRFFDLMRYGKTIAEEALHHTNFNYETHRYFPIPQSERDINKSL